MLTFHVSRFTFVALLIQQIAFAADSDWPAFRSGPERSGAVAGSKGPADGKKLWNFKPDSGAIDSSPAVAGSQVCFGLSVQSPFRKYGALGCVDAQTGAVVWQYSGEKELDAQLQPVFSSPAIAGDSLVCGEGYHVERNCRLICLDLSPVKNKQAPKLRWALKTTSHVESSPCIFEGKAYVGAGDDGIWCVDVASGQVKWRLEGVPHYYLKMGPQVEALANLSGKIAVVTGAVERVWADDGSDNSNMLIDVKSFSEPRASASGSPDTGPNRTITGKVVLMSDPPKGVEGAIQMKIEIPEFYADAESSPVAVKIGNEPRLFFGLGMEGLAAVCVNADTGKLIWRTKTPHPAFGAPAVVDGKVLIALSNETFDKPNAAPFGAVLCLSAADGKELWQVKADGGILGAVAVSNGQAYACSRDKHLYVLDIKDGRLISKCPIGEPSFCSPAVTEQSVYVTAGSRLLGIKRADHSVQWAVDLTPGEAILSSPSVSGTRVFVGSASKGLFCIGE